MAVIGPTTEQRGALHMLQLHPMKFTPKRPWESMEAVDITHCLEAPASHWILEGFLWMAVVAAPVSIETHCTCYSCIQRNPESHPWASLEAASNEIHSRKTSMSLLKNTIQHSLLESSCQSLDS
jgi:hypothetical protein